MNALPRPSPVRLLSILLLSLAVGCSGSVDAAPLRAQDASATSDSASSTGSLDDDAFAWPWSATGEDGGIPPIPTSSASGPPSLGSPSPSGYAPSPDAGCTAPPSAGDLLIDELMIQSVSGTGDYGEWIEVASTRPCALDIRGLHGDCPSGSKVRTFDIDEDLWIPPFGTFLVADSADPATNHDLPAPLVVWSGQPGDVLRNKGGTVDLWLGDTLVDTLTFPALKLTIGASVAFPADCDPSVRSDWSAWQTSTASFFPGFFGTPNAANTDVSCAVSPQVDAGP